MSLDRRGFVGRLAAVLGIAGPSAASGLPETPAAPRFAGPEQATKGQSEKAPASKGYIRSGTISIVEKDFDLVVIGGGISGTCAAISAARNGVKVALVHERSMLGGNSSSEVRLFPEDTLVFSPWIKESGILEEIVSEERVRNWEPYLESLMNCHWDLVLYEWVVREKKLTLFLNTTMREVEMRDSEHILAVHAAQLGTEKAFILRAPLFMDATGDGVLGYRAGAPFHWGQEGRQEYGETLAPEEPTDEVMGNTLFFRARNTGKPIEFRRPAWSAEFPAEADLTGRGHGFIEGGYWWIEVGYPLHPIKDNEEIRHEALRQLLGVWDHIKNRCSDTRIRDAATNYALEFVGFWPYKRASRRILGDYVLQERDVRSPGSHPDDIAYGGWGIDRHVPGGIHRRDVAPYPEPGSSEYFQSLSTIPYGIPFRCCYSRNIRNLLTAGRPISASYIAYASSRVLTTGSVVGQGVGAAAAMCKKYRCEPREVARNHAAELQQLLLRQDAFIPGVENQDRGDLAKEAAISASGDCPLVFPDSQTFRQLNFPLAQIFPVSTDRIEAVELLLKSDLATPVQLRLGLCKAGQVWDFRTNGEVATAVATVPAKHQGFIRFDVKARTEPGTLYYVHLGNQEGVSWAVFTDSPEMASLVPVAASPADQPPNGNRWRPLTNGKCFSMRVDPIQRPYGPKNVVIGTSRPDQWSNIFISDPERELPAWLELRWPQPILCGYVQVTFDTDVNRRVERPLFRCPDCVKRYDIALATGGGWKVVWKETDNYVRCKSHTFGSVRSDRLRIQVHETNGAKSARIYEVRVYERPPELIA
jgi:hypothetical protein